MCRLMASAMLVVVSQVAIARANGETREMAAGSAGGPPNNATGKFSWWRAGTAIGARCTKAFTIVPENTAPAAVLRVGGVGLFGYTGAFRETGCESGGIGRRAGLRSRSRKA